MSIKVYALQHAVWVPPVETVLLSVRSPDGIDPYRFCLRLNRVTLGHHLPRRLRSKLTARLQP